METCLDYLGRPYVFPEKMAAQHGGPQRRHIYSVYAVQIKSLISPWNTFAGSKLAASEAANVCCVQQKPSAQNLRLQPFCKPPAPENFD